MKRDRKHPIKDKTFVSSLISFSDRHPSLRTFVLFILTIIFLINRIGASLTTRSGKLRFLFACILLTLFAGVSVYSVSYFRRASELKAHAELSQPVLASIDAATPEPLPEPSNAATPEAITTVQKADGAFMIYTADDMLSFASQVNDGMHELNALLMADIDLSGTEWVPVGESDISDGNLYNGTFDGNGHTISGLTLNSTGSFSALFGRTGSCIIKNLSIASGYVSGSSHISLLASENHGVIADCTVSGTLYGGADSILFGGIAGVNYGSILRCTSSVTVEGGAYLGGIAGSNQGELIDCSSSCSIHGEIAIGGLVGSNEDGTIRSSYTDMSCRLSGDTGVGGIVGINNAASSLWECHSSASVDGLTASAGISGINYGEISACFLLAADDSEDRQPEKLSGINYGIIQETDAAD